MFKSFLDEHFLLNNKTAEQLYHEYAAKMSVIDYHNHLCPRHIAEDYKFADLTEVWLHGDHYKWRAMRANGINETYITGDASNHEKFYCWAVTVPYTVRNPLFHWTHLELQRYFNITELLTSSSANRIYYQCNEMLETESYTTLGLLKKMNVKLLCTTDDPVDTLEYHKQINEGATDIKVFPAFRPDKALDVSNPEIFNSYLSQLEAVSGKSISTVNDYLDALKSRHDFFALNGCTISDHGLEHLFMSDFTEREIQSIFNSIRIGKKLSIEEQFQFKTYMLLLIAEWNYDKGWVQQFHLGPLRNNNSRLNKLLGADAGVDSIGDFIQAKPMASFLNALDERGKLAKTILYNLNPADNAVFATMAGNFNDGSVPGKIQWGSAWWFLDQKDGIEQQLNTLSNMGLLSRFVGMLTDSRSFLSFPRHEYFRRILCNCLGEEIERGEIPNDIKWIGSMVQDICFNNAKSYFNWNNII